MGTSSISGIRVVRGNIKAILSNAVTRKHLMVNIIVATQAREGIETSVAQAEAAYNRVCSKPLHMSHQSFEGKLS